MRAKREPERTAVPGGHESPSGAFKPQTGLRSKCRVFSAARSQRFRRAGSDGLRRQLPAGERGRPLRLLPMVAATSPKGRGKKHSRYALGSPFGRAGAKRLRGFVPPQGASGSKMLFAATTPPVKMCLERPCGCAAMKAPVGLSSRRAVCDSRWKDFVLTSVGAAPNTNIKIIFR